MLVDSHCHLDCLDLSPYEHNFGRFVLDAKSKGLQHMMCISIDLEAYPAMRELVGDFGDISVTAGVHPNARDGRNPSIEELVRLAKDPKVVGIGETGLDYFRSQGDLEWQRTRFRNHIRAAKKIGKPLVVHSRDAKEDTLKVLREEGAEEVGGVIHCFTEDWDMAVRAMELDFHISFSGIVTFKNAQSVREVAQKIPHDRYLIETDSPYLAPVPYRGKTNYPIYVRHVAEQIAELRGESFAQVAETSADNFYRLFGARS
ncbi:MAG: TatD family hydrolase [Methylococcaceae bacterium]|nr:TatD family hydrolase [Methylococcaceae bacterium]MCI0734434.1 TatD family hydrolase [Methylococcaceae bacterium]